MLKNYKNFIPFKMKLGDIYTLGNNFTRFYRSFGCWGLKKSEQFERLHPLIFEYQDKSINEMDDDFLIDMPSLAKKLKTVTSIVERKKGIIRFRSGIKRIVNLRELDVSNNQISLIPDEIMNLKQLQKMCLDSNNLSQINESLKYVATLEELSISNNSIYSIPDIFKWFNKLKYVDLSSNYINEISVSLLEMKELKELNLSNNLISKLDFPTLNIDKLKMEKIDLSNNGLLEVPSWIKGATNLTEINLSNNYIKSVPSFICNLPNLNFIDLRHNNIQDKNTDQELGRVQLKEKLDGKVLLDSRDLWKVKPLSIEDVLDEERKNDLYWNIGELSKFKRISPKSMPESFEKICEVLKDFEIMHGNLLKPQISSIKDFIYRDKNMNSSVWIPEITDLQKDSNTSVLIPEILDLIRAILNFSKKNQLIENVLFHISNKIQENINNMSNLLIDLRKFYMMCKFDVNETKSVLLFIKYMIALEKDNVFDFETILGDLNENSQLIKYWKYNLKEVIGFGEQSKMVIEQENPIRSPGYVLESFLKKFRPRLIISKLCEYINMNDYMKKEISNCQHDCVDTLQITEKLVERYLIENRILISNN